MPAGSAPSGLGWDKLNHAAAMGAVTLFAYLALQSYRWAAVAAFLYGTFLGLLIELLQATLTTTRSAEWSDVAADLVGAGCVWGAIRIYQLKTAPKQ
jgi:VanZ family protein